MRRAGWGGESEFETYVLIANPSAELAQARATFLRADGSTVVKTYDVLPTSRFNIWVNAMVPELQHEHFGVLIEVLNDVNVAVERALYWQVGRSGALGRDERDCRTYSLGQTRLDERASAKGGVVTSIPAGRRAMRRNVEEVRRPSARRRVLALCSRLGERRWARRTG